MNYSTSRQLNRKNSKFRTKCEIIKFILLEIDPTFSNALSEGFPPNTMKDLKAFKDRCWVCISTLVKNSLLTKEKAGEKTSLDRFNEIKFVELLRNLSDIAVIEQIKQQDPAARILSLPEELLRAPNVAKDFNSALKTHISIAKDK